MALIERACSITRHSAKHSKKGKKGKEEKGALVGKSNSMEFRYARVPILAHVILSLSSATSR